MSKFRTSFRYWLQIFIIPFHILSFLMPRNKNIWVFGSTFGRRFADSPRYFYLYLNQLKRGEVTAIWISKDKELVKELVDQNLPAYYLYSMKGIWYVLRAGVYLYDNYTKDICFTLSGRARKINLWHGVPLKKIQMDNIFDRVRHPKNVKERLLFALRRMTDEKPSHYVLATSKELRPIFSSAFQTNKVLICGYPRNDVCNQLINNYYLKEEAKALKEILQKQKGKKILFYMPTFRDSEIDFFKVVQLDILQGFLEKNDFLLCVKLHPKSKLTQAFSSLESNHIVIIPQDADPYVFLWQADALITDYSSIYFDYLIFDRPMIFFCYDIAQYLAESREFYFDYQEATPGYKATTLDELLAGLESLEKITNQYQSARLALRKKVLNETTGYYCEKLFQLIIDTYH